MKMWCMEWMMNQRSFSHLYQNCATKFDTTAKPGKDSPFGIVHIPLFLHLPLNLCMQTTQVPYRDHTLHRKKTKECNYCIYQSCPICRLWLTSKWHSINRSHAIKKKNGTFEPTLGSSAMLYIHHAASYSF